MDNKKIIFIPIAAGIVIAIILLTVKLIFPKKPVINQNINVGPIVNVNRPALPLVLPPSPPRAELDGLSGDLAKEKIFISSFYQLDPFTFSAQAPQYNLPIINLKDTVANYRDFSRKIDIDKILDSLATDSFTVIKNPFPLAAKDLESIYKALNEKKVPIFVTSDSLLALYQLTLNVIFKEIEQEVFYPSLWEVTKGLFDKSRLRYEQQVRPLGITSDLLTEANRLELAYFTVALELLKPKANQIREGVTILKGDRFFSSQEVSSYQLFAPPYLKDEVQKEIQLINQHSGVAKSPIFLYQQDYSQFTIPPQYNTSEKLKNYYLTLIWLNQLFPLFTKSEDCPNCLLDNPDSNINFITASLMADDLKKDQNLKNAWANIYKTISFFKGLQLDLIYLHYLDALQSLFGQNYNPEEIFGKDLNKAQENIEKLREKLNEYEFLGLLGGEKTLPEKKGLRLLRNYFLAEKYIFDQLTYPQVKEYQGTISSPKDLPYTACFVSDLKNHSRCWPLGLDIFNLMGLKSVEKIILEQKDNFYLDYLGNLEKLKQELEKFDQYSWHDNAYWGLLDALKTILLPLPNGYPTFMQNQKWFVKQLNNALAAWTLFHQETLLEKREIIPSSSSLLKSPESFNHGYVEPVPYLYNQILANIEMMKKGFLDLKILDLTEKSMLRLDYLQDIFQKAGEISIKELENQELDTLDYEFINNFYNQINSVIGDIKQERLAINFSFQPYKNPVLGKNLYQHLDNFNLIIIIYPDLEGKMFLGIGPVFNYFESKDMGKSLSEWQKEYLK